MIRERLDGETIKGAFFVWTTGLAPVQWGDVPPAAQVGHLRLQTPVRLRVASQASPGPALAVVPTPPVAEIQPAISCGVLELVKFTLELE